MWLCPTHHRKWHKENGFSEGFNSNRGYKFIPLSLEVHKELSILKAQEGLTFDEMVQKLVHFYQANTAV